MIRVQREGDVLTWESALVPTEAGLQQLPEYGGFTATARGRAALHTPRNRSDQSDRSRPSGPSEDWPTDPPFRDD